MSTTFNQPVNAADPSEVEAFVDTFFTAVLGAQAVQAAYLGDRLGWYRALAAEPGGLTSVELAGRTATSERYAREWLEHQVVAGYLEVDDPSAGPQDRRYTLPPAHAEVLTDELSLNYVAPLGRIVAGLGLHLDKLLEAYRTGGGVSWAQFGTDAREAQAAANRPLFLNVLGQEYLPQIPDVHERLTAGGRVADVGTGAGWSSIGIALAYPNATVDGYDVDEPSVEMARRNAAESGVGDRVRFHVVDGAGIDAGEPYDLVCAFECIHDMSDPVAVLATMRRLAGGTGETSGTDGTGAVIVMDERVGEAFTGEHDPVEQIMYGYSLTCCLPDGLAHQPSVGTGTVMRPATLERYATEAGFERVEILDIDNDFFRFYRLR